MSFHNIHRGFQRSRHKHIICTSTLLSLTAMSSSLDRQNEKDTSLRHVCSPTLVKQRRKFLNYERKQESTEMITDIYATGYFWDLTKSVDNTDGTINATQKTTIEVGRTTKSGSEWEVHFDLSAGYGGVSLNVGGSYKSFSEQEMSKKTTTEMTFEIREGTAFYLYQKVYTFNTVTWFINDAGGKERIVYTEGGKKKLELKSSFDSTTLEQKVTSKPLDEKVVNITIKGTEEEVIKQDDSKVAYEDTASLCHKALACLGSKLYES